MYINRMYNCTGYDDRSVWSRYGAEGVSFNFKKGETLQYDTYRSPSVVRFVGPKFCAVHYDAKNHYWRYTDQNTQFQGDIDYGFISFKRSYLLVL